MKTFYHDDPNLTDHEKQLVERSYHMFRTIRTMYRTFINPNRKAFSRQLYIDKHEPSMDEAMSSAKSAHHLYALMTSVYDQLMHDIKFDNCRDDYIIAMNKLPWDKVPGK